MKITNFKVEQNSPEWYAARCGHPTASEFSTVKAKGRGGKGPSLTRQKYMRKLVGERVCGQAEPSYYNEDMARGHEMEAEARAFYELSSGHDVEQTGFLYNHDLKAGCSLDGLIDDEGFVEIKTCKPSVLVERMVDVKAGNKLAHWDQVQGGLWLSGRKWADIVFYWPKMPPVIVTVEPDAAWQDEMKRELEAFHYEMDELEKMVRAWQ